MNTPLKELAQTTFVFGLGLLGGLVLGYEFQRKYSFYDKINIELQNRKAAENPQQDSIDSLLPASIVFETTDGDYLITIEGDKISATPIPYEF